MKIQKILGGGGVGIGRLGGVGLGGQGGCERRSEVFVKIQKKKWGWGGSGQGGGQGGSEQRIEIFVKIQKKSGKGRGVGGLRVDVNEEVKFL